MKALGNLIYRLMGRFEEIVSMTMITITVSVTCVNVFVRYLTHGSIPWAQEVSGIAWTWCVMLGISWCYRRNMHMGVDFLIERLKPSVRRAVYIFSFAALFAAIVFLAYISILITINGHYKLTNYFNIPYSIKYVSAVISFINMAIYSLCFIYIAIKRPDEFLDRVALDGNGLDDFTPIEEIEGMEGEEG